MGRKYKSNGYFNKKKIDDMTLIWLDKSINRSEDNYYSMNNLCHLIQKIRTFSRIDRFIEYLSNELNEQMILIVSGSLGEEIIPKIHHYHLIDSIYIFCQNKTKHRLWTKAFKKIQGVFNDMDFLCLYLRKKKLFQKNSNDHLIEKNSLDNSNSLKFIESDYFDEQVKEEFLSYYTENEALSASDMIDRDLDQYKDANIDSYLMYFSSNDNIEKVDLKNCVEHSNTVMPFIQQTDQKYMDNGIWPCLCWISKNENHFSKMIPFNRIRHLIFHTRIIENLDIYFQSLKNSFNEEHFLVICDTDHLELYLPRICHEENVRRIYLHSSLNSLEEYQRIIKSFSKLISILQYSDTLIHMILHDFVLYLIKLAEHYQKENKKTLAKIRYEYALHLQSNIRLLIKERIQSLEKQ